MGIDGEDSRLYDVVIVGAGLAGLATALGLFERGITNIAVIEKARALSPVGASIAIFDNGLRALEHISPSVAELVRRSCVPVERLVVKDEEGNFLHEKKPHVRVNYMVWYLLQQYLKERLPPGILLLGNRVDSFQATNCGDQELVTIHISDVRQSCSNDGNSSFTVPHTIRTKVLVGADGINSVVRRQLFAEISHQKLYHGKVSYRVAFPTSALLKDDNETKHDSDKVHNEHSTSHPKVPSVGTNTTYQGEEQGKIFSYRETSPGIVTVTSMAPAEDPAEDYSAAETGNSKERFCSVFKKFTAKEVQQILSVAPSVHIDPIHDVDVLDCWSKGNIIVVGDAAHAMSPSLGQGANLSLEDACVLVHKLTRVLLLQGKPTPIDKGENKSDDGNLLRDALSNVWRPRIDRVKKVHAASRTRSFANNKTSKTKPLDLTSEELKDLLTEIGNWRPPMVDLNAALLPSRFEVLGAKIHGDYSDVLEFQSLDVDMLQLRPNDVLVRVFFTDVNPVDLQKLRGRDTMIGRNVENPPHISGYGGSGMVVGVGSSIRNAGMAASWRGQPVCFLADPTRSGSYATHIAVDVNCVAKIPSLPPSGWSLSGSSFWKMQRDCACIPVAGITAYESLAKCSLVTTPEKNGKFENNDDFTGSLLVVGASGGVGSWTITLARALNPRLEIIATASNQAQHDWCISLGSNRVMKHDEISSKLKGGREGSVDAIICLTEPTNDLFGAISDVIKPYGTICLVVAGNSIGSLNLGFCFFKCVDVKTETVFSSIRTNYKKIVPAEELKVIIGLLASGKIKAPLSPELENGSVSESFQDALGDCSVLKALSEREGRRGNFVMKMD